MATPAPARPISIARSSQSTKTSGVLPILAANPKSRAPNSASSSTKAPTPRLKVVLRRLAPGLTEAEFYSTLGEEWKVGGERVDWASYRPGKISKDPVKPSRPSRAYLHLTKDEYLTPLSNKVRGTAFLDAKGSSSDSALLGPPSAEFAPYGKAPTNKPRKDGRQGTIDQDQEFIDFLESLTNPTLKPTPVDSGSDKETKGHRGKEVTPLIQFLRDKKANKGKDPAAPAKVLKHGRQDSKDNKGGLGDKKLASKPAKDPAAVEKRSASAIKVEKAARDAVKALNKQANVVSSRVPAANGAASTAKAQEISPSPASPAPKIERKRERGNANALAKLVQRDLGLGSSPAGRKKVDSNTAASPATASIQSSAAPSAPKAVIENTSAQTSSGKTTPANANVAQASSSTPTTQVAQPPSGPAAARNQAKATLAQRPAASCVSQVAGMSKETNTSLAVSTSTQAFLKHANPSQGITELLLEEAFTLFGTVNKVEIDKKKGFAYIDFSTSEALQTAIAASPVNVAQGKVVVLERKTGASLQNRNARGGGQSTKGRGGVNPSNSRDKGGSIRGRGGRAQPNTAKMTPPTVPSQTTTSTNTASATQSGTSSEAKKPVAISTTEAASAG